MSKVEIKCNPIIFLCISYPALIRALSIYSDHSKHGPATLLHMSPLRKQHSIKQYVHNLILECYFILEMLKPILHENHVFPKCWLQPHYPTQKWTNLLEEAIRNFSYSEQRVTQENGLHCPVGCYYSIE